MAAKKMLASSFSPELSLAMVYKQLAKKEKGILINGMLQDPSFLKGKEWLRKYIAGTYKQDQTVEQIGFRILLDKMGISPRSFSPFHLVSSKPSMSVPTVSSQEPSPVIEPVTSIPFTGSPPLENWEKELISLFQAAFQNDSISTTGAAWAKICRLCRAKNYQKINPFLKVKQLIQKGLINNDLQEATLCIELQTIFQQGLQATLETEYVWAWEQFSLKARYVYYKNPFTMFFTFIQNTFPHEC